MQQSCGIPTSPPDSSTKLRFCHSPKVTARALLDFMNVLIISPHFPPTNAADMQRVRLILPYLKEFGIHAEVLCVEPAQVAAPLDAWLASGLPTEVPVHRVQALSLRWSRIPGLGTLGLRAANALKKAGDRLLAGGAFDLVYFSTTVFGIHSLGVRWKKRFGVPFTMDYQDPWVTNYYAEHPEIGPPGGKFKYAVVDWLARRWEPKVLRECAGITSVSVAYPKELAARYSWLNVVDVGHRNQSGLQHPEIPQLLSAVLPFPGDTRDFERMLADRVSQTVFDPADGLCHWVYVGVCPPSMLFALRAFFQAFKNSHNDHYGKLNTVRLHFVGTSYAPAGRGLPNVAPLAQEMGLASLVEERTDRIPYSDVLRCLSDADALIVVGSDDPSYTASKIYPYLLAGKPLLAVFHEQSSVVGLMRNVGGGTVVSFNDTTSSAELAARIQAQGFDTNGGIRATPLDRAAFVPNTARHQASQLANFWKQVLI
jgi:hypothetical protein